MRGKELQTQCVRIFSWRGWLVLTGGKKKVSRSAKQKTIQRDSIASMAGKEKATLGCFSRLSDVGVPLWTASSLGESSATDRDMVGVHGGGGSWSQIVPRLNSQARWDLWEFDIHICAKPKYLSYIVNLRHRRSLQGQEHGGNVTKTWPKRGHNAAEPSEIRNGPFKLPTSRFTHFRHFLWFLHGIAPPNCKVSWFDDTLYIIGIDGVD